MNRLTITFIEGQLPTVEAVENGVHTQKSVSLTALLEALVSNAALPSRIIPEQLVATNSVDTHIFHLPPGRRDLILDDVTLPQIPLPGLLLAVKGENGLVAEVRLFALKDRGRPTSSTPLFVAPLPNTSANGEICWGSASIKSCRIEAWELILAEFFGSRFTAHGCSDSCRSYPEDVRQLLVGLMGEESFPEDELLPVEARCPTTLGELVERMV